MFGCDGYFTGSRPRPTRRSHQRWDQKRGSGPDDWRDRGPAREVGRRCRSIQSGVRRRDVSCFRKVSREPEVRWTFRSRVRQQEPRRVGNAFVGAHPIRFYDHCLLADRDGNADQSGWWSSIGVVDLARVPEEATDRATWMGGAGPKRDAGEDHTATARLLGRRNPRTRLRVVGDGVRPWKPSAATL